MRILPTTRLGRLGIVILAVAVALYVFVLLLVVDGPGASTALGLGPTLLLMAMGSVLALIAILRRGERALLAWVALVPGVLVILALIAEVTGLIE